MATFCRHPGRHRRLSKSAATRLPDEKLWRLELPRLLR